MSPGLKTDKNTGASPKSTGTANRPRKPRCKKGYNGASLLTRVFYCWLDPLMWLGFRRKQLRQEDLFETPNYALSQDVLTKFEKHWQQELERKAKGKEPRLWIPVCSLMWRRLVMQCLMGSTVITINILQSIILGWLTDYFVNPKTPESTKNAFLMALMIVLIGFGNALCCTWEYDFALQSGVRVRTAVTGALFKRSICSHLQTIENLSVGKIMTLLSNDVRRFDSAFIFLHYLILAPLHNIAVLLLLWLYLGLGPSCLPGLLLLLLQLPIQYLLSSIFMHLRLRSAEFTDERVKATNQFIAGIRVLKMYGWEYAFKELVSQIRKKEAMWVFLANLFRAANSALINFSSGLINLLIFSTYVLTTGNSITPRMVFTTLSLVTYVRIVSSSAVTEGVLGVREMKVAFKRLKDFLLRDFSSQGQLNHYNHDPGNTLELMSKAQSHGICNNGLVSGAQTNAQSTELSATVKVTDLSAAWNFGGGSDERPTLQNITFECNASNRMLAIVGPVGAGKSTILYCLLGELEPLSGDIAIAGTLGYAAQEPWLFNGSMRENILLGLEYEEDWYQKVVDACCLKEDIEQLSFGDMTLVGERGVSLSGGQKARVALARAVYRKADIYLLDDPLSAVDAAVGRRLFENCLCGLLKSSIVVLVTHQLQYAQMADSILMISQGQPLAYGGFKEIMQSCVDDGTVGTALNEMLTSLIKGLETFPLDDDLVNHTSAAETMGECVKASQRRNNKSSITGDSMRDEPDKFSNEIDEEDKVHLSMRTYLNYFKAGGGYVFSCFMIMLFLLTQGNLVTADWYLSQWSTTSQLCVGPNSTGLLCNLTVTTIVEVYSGLVSSAIVLSITRAVLFYYLCVNAARNLHNKMFGAVLRAPVRFFDRNPVGRVLIRFSKDLYFLDNVISRQLFDLLDQSLQCASIMIVSGVANWYMSISGTIVIVVLILLRCYYMKAAMEIKRLEALARSPLYSHISDTLQGLTTIRACKREKASMDSFYSFMDENSKGWIFYFNGNRWFVLRSDLISTVFVGVVAFSSIPLAEALNPALVGLSLVYALSLADTFRYIVRNSADVEGNMLSAERVIEYSKLQPEASLGTPPGREQPPELWPQSGAIHLHQMKFRYAEDTPYILKGISVDINPGEKVGIVGRTGAGKSSLMQALFRMAEPEGTVQIDDVNVTEIGLHTLRKKLSIIPQDPVLFSGSVRYNLDPFGEYSDEAIWFALEQVQLKAVVAVMPGGLSSALTERGSNFSVGQRQLMCLARAVLKRNKILIIDEATANVDRVTDAIIQQTIRREFVGCTTLTIAHRLNTIMDSDRIMVLSAGRVVEFDTPHVLLQSKESLLSQLVEQADLKESKQLKEIASSKYKNTEV